MADQHHASADDEATAGSRAVRSTKLHVPRPPPGFVARPRLGERLDAAGPRSVALVCAPAGCGKSVLVADWCRRQPSPVAWLSLDPDDDDPIRFWRHLAAALDRAGGGATTLPREVDRLIRRAGDPPLDEIADVVLSWIDGAVDDVVLVLDDYHAIEADEVHAGVRRLLEQAPAQLRTVVISRADPPLLLARRRASGELTEIRAADLQFSAEEAADLLEQATGGPLAAGDVAALTDRTEGWAVGLQLAALSLAGRDDVPAFVSTFSGSHRFVLDYLTEEVLDRQSAPVREFLLATSVLQRLSGPSCDAVTGGDDGQELLEACERANLFLVPLDDDRRWWRYHHLFAELLRLELERRYPGRATELHRRAADWYERHGSIDEAIGHAVAAGDTDRSVRLIERHADELLFRREEATLRRHMADLPSGATRRVLVAQARTAAYAGRLGEADRLLDAAAVATAAAEAPFEPSVDRQASPLAVLDPTTDLLRAFVAHLRGDVDAATALAEGVLAEVDDEGTTIGLIARWYLAVDPWLRGAVAQAEPALERDIERWREVGDPGRGALSSHYLGRVQRARGDLDGATETYRRLLATSADATVEPPTAVAHVGLAEVAYERDDLDAARRHVAAGVDLGRQLVYSQALSTGLATMAWLRRADGDVDGAVAAMDEAVDVGPDEDVVDLLDPVRVRRAQLLLAEGEDRAARAWTARRGVGLDDAPHHPVEPVHLLLARLEIHRGRGHRAVPLLDRLLRAAIDDGRTGSTIEIEVLRALALAADDPASSSSALLHALALAAPQGHVRRFVDEGGTDGRAARRGDRRPGHRRRRAPSRTRPCGPADPRRRRGSGRVGGRRSGCAAARRAAHPARAGGARPAGHRQAQPGDRRRALRVAQHREEAHHPHPREAGCRQPHRRGRPCPDAGPAPLTHAPAGPVRARHLR